MDLMRLLKRISTVCVVGYLAAFGAVIVSQRSLIYHPTPPGPRTPSEFGIPFEKVQIPVGKGEVLAAWWIHHEDPRQHPTVVYCHGNGATLSMFPKVASIFYNLGWNALIFDYRGYGESSNASEGLSEMSTAIDAEAAYRWVLERTSERKVLIWGHSLGSSIAARLASQHSPRGLVLEGGFPSLFEMARVQYPYFPIMRFMLLDRFDTAQYLQGKKFPVMVMHAERDTIIPLDMGRKLFNELAEPKEFVLVRAVNHNDFPEVHAEYHELLKESVQRWMH